jgi:hypothetical protein
VRITDETMIYYYCRRRDLRLTTTQLLCAVAALAFGFTSTTATAEETTFDLSTEITSALSAGEIQLIVNADGSLSIEGDTAEIISYQILSASGLLIPDADGPELGLLAYASNVSTEVAAFGLAPVAVDGVNPIDPAVSTLTGLDLVFNYGLASGQTVSGEIVVIPEPTSLALLGLGGLLIARRRRD